MTLNRKSTHHQSPLHACIHVLFSLHNYSELSSGTDVEDMNTDRCVLPCVDNAYTKWQGSCVAYGSESHLRKHYFLLIMTSSELGCFVQKLYPNSNHGHVHCTLV